MKILKTNQNKVDKKVIDEAVKVLADGGVILYPTDTVYGLGANIFNRKAVKRVYNIDVYQVEKLNRGSANLYSLNENKYILKEFQAKYKKTDNI